MTVDGAATMTTGDALSVRVQLPSSPDLTLEIRAIELDCLRDQEAGFATFHVTIEAVDASLPQLSLLVNTSKNSRSERPSIKVQQIFHRGTPRSARLGKLEADEVNSWLLRDRRAVRNLGHGRPRYRLKNELREEIEQLLSGGKR